MTRPVRSAISGSAFCVLPGEVMYEWIGQARGQRSQHSHDERITGLTCVGIVLAIENHVPDAITLSYHAHPASLRGDKVVPQPDSRQPRLLDLDFHDTPAVDLPTG